MEILQWNIRGLQANREELNIFTSQFNPTIVCLQETFLIVNKSVKFNNYSIYSNLAEEINGTNHGVVSILIKSSTLNKSILSLACRQLLSKPLCTKLSLCSLYLPPSSKYNVANF